ncbi:MAG TPA: hybrid sensor histidine kinase/response regulator [Smithellaceae bacterium]|nr:hybrid sensor histidine kinase/response regulator [Smithellaceae bacterium]HRS88600.1 hybrid sensor histidine kinase/response regulator [Smithellaceae bacterium]HRV25880.1 hybrid sensor histidine kinase/response regulator [Smithellaceae bacterium]
MSANNDKPLILIIDDEEALRDGCRQVLEKSGYEVITAAQGAEGIKMARERVPDMVFVDLKMPNMSGMEIMEILSKDIPDTILVMITGYASIVSAVEAMQKGAYDYLPKPFSPDQLRVLTKRGLEHRTLRLEAKKLKEEKDLMQKNFITFVSHEMRSPLVVVRQYFETLKEIAADKFDNDIKEIMERCSKRLENLEELVEHWLDISRIENGTFAQRKEAVMLSSVIKRAIEEMAPVCRKRKITVEADVPDNLPAVKGDEESLVRVFTNLIGNASKYTPEEGKIKISVEKDDYYIRINVTDTGCGIPADKLPFVFEPFFRVKGKEERDKGSGLGLAFCKKIMESHHGRIEMSSREGEGTTCLLTFPVEVETGK